MVSINNVSVEFSARPLFSDAAFVIGDTDRIALTGKNGAGKSTLLKIIAGFQEPTSGTVTRPAGVKIGYLPQQMEVADETTVAQEVRKAFGESIRMRSELNNLLEELNSDTDVHSDAYAARLERIDFLNERLAVEGFENMDAEIERTLRGLGFSREDLDRPTYEFSGGWRMRIELAKLLLQRPDVLLLDEPTNHLEIESIQWLEQFLAKKAKGVVLVSHDRAFIDNVTNRTIEISCGRLYDYRVKYTDYVRLRRERVEQQQRAYENQQKLIADTKDFINRFRYKPTKAVQVQSRIKMLEKLEIIEVDEVDNSRVHLKFPPAPRSGDYPLILDDVGKAFGDHQVFDHATLTLKRGEKVAFVGKNGEGKTTLVKCIMGQLPHSGRLTIGHNVKIGYFAQNQAQLLDGDLTVFDTVDHVAVGDIRTSIRDILGAFLFGGEACDKKVKVLSGGEKTRLAMIKLLLEPVNLLILDEPTNHLDMVTKDILKEAIRDFDGTVIVVSHDREFLDGLVEKVYEFGGGRVREHLGGIYDFLRTKNIESLKELEKKDVATSSVPKAEAQPSVGKLSYAEQKERDRIIKRATKRVERAMEAVEALEGEQKEIEDLLAGGDTSADTLKRYDEIQKKMDLAMEEYEVAENELEDINKNSDH